jgi:hypothetical protein
VNFLNHGAYDGPTSRDVGGSFTLHKKQTKMSTIFTYDTQRYSVISIKRHSYFAFEDNLIVGKTFKEGKDNKTRPFE